MHTTGDTSSRLLQENLMSLSAAARTLPSYRRGRPTHPATLSRWITNGAKRPGGGRVRLEAVRAPSGWRTSRQALERFFAALTPNLDQQQSEGATLPRSAKSRTRAAERASRELEKLNI